MNDIFITNSSTDFTSLLQRCKRLLEQGYAVRIVCLRYRNAIKLFCIDVSRFISMALAPVLTVLLI